MHSFHLWSSCPYLECFAVLQNWITSCNKSALPRLLSCLVVFMLSSLFSFVFPLLSVNHPNRLISTSHIFLSKMPGKLPFLS